MASDKAPTLALMVARADNGVIGRNNELPWHLPSELKWFRKRTWGHPVIMGRKTFESIGKALPGRDNIVLTRGRIMDDPKALTVNSFEEALALAERLAVKRGVDEIFVIGGGQIFDKLRQKAQRIYLTRVHMEADGDTTFPEPEPAIWKKVSSERFTAQEGDTCDYTIEVYERKS
ncbi:MAG TPA: dihydrofolate reductase [Thermopetrobacter sp.]|nr:dihydrofolate reductase [Thermopetrobacter sp.]